jgi:hypothetical protein
MAETMAESGPEPKQEHQSSLLSLEHCSLFGYPDGLPSERVTTGHWTSRPFTAPLTSAWDVPIEPEHLRKLIIGFQPQVMEDKWFIYSEGPDAEGRLFVNMHRSWTGLKVFQLELRAGEKGQQQQPPTCIVAITWESSPKNITIENEAEAKSFAADVCRWVLGTSVRLQE